MHMTDFTRLSLTSVLQATKVSGQVKSYMRYTQYVTILPTLLAVLTRFNRVVFDSLLHLHFVASRDGSALEKGKTRKLTTIHHGLKFMTGARESGAISQKAYDIIL